MGDESSAAAIAQYAKMRKHPFLFQPWPAEAFDRKFLELIQSVKDGKSAEQLIEAKLLFKEVGRRHRSCCSVSACGRVCACIRPVGRHHTRRAHRCAIRLAPPRPRSLSRSCTRPLSRARSSSHARSPAPSPLSSHPPHALHTHTHRSRGCTRSRCCSSTSVTRSSVVCAGGRDEGPHRPTPMHSAEACCGEVF